MTDPPAEVPLEELRRVHAADVYKGERLAARIWRQRDDVLFSYRPDYLADADAPAVAWTLPKTDEVLTTPAGAVPAFFAGLLPEGIRLRAVVAGTRTSEDDHLTLLIAVGADTIGDVRVVPAGARPADPPTTVAEDRIPALRLADVFALSPAYDLVSTQPYLGWRDPMALDLYGRANRLDRHHLVESGGRLGLPERAVARVLDHIADRAEPWLDRIDRIGLGERPTELLRALMRTRLAELRTGSVR